MVRDIGYVLMLIVAKLSQTYQTTTEARMKIIDDESGESVDYHCCDGCGGLGWIDIGDCEDGVIDTCPECEGEGVVPDEQ